MLVVWGVWPVGPTRSAESHGKSYEDGGYCICEVLRAFSGCYFWDFSLLPIINPPLYIKTERRWVKRQQCKENE